MILAGVATIAVATVLGLFVGLVLWPRIGTATGVCMAAGVGALGGVGAMLLTPDPSPLDWVAALGLLAVCSPPHALVLFGRPGGRRVPRVVAGQGKAA